MVDISQFVVNNTEYNVADDTKVPYDLLKDTVGFTSKNLIPFPYKSSSSITIQGVTFTVNADTSITVNGTNNGSGTAWYAFHDTINLSNGDYIFSGCPSGGSNTTYKMSLTTTEGRQDTGNGVSVTVNNGTVTSVSIGIGAGYTANNLVFRPMLRKADIMDDTYEQYNPSVKQVLRNNKIIEGKNLFSYPYNETTHTEAGITFTDNGDGTVTANGTATGNSFFSVKLWTGINSFPFKNTELILSGCPSGGSENTYRVDILELSTGNLKIDYGNGVNIPSTYFNTNTNNIECRIRIGSGTTVSNVVFKPMLRKATETDSTYEPYYIPGVVSQEAQNVLGAKNLLQNKGVSETKNGITFTNNSDGSVTANGTATDNAYHTIWSKLADEPLKGLKHNVQYVLSGDSKNNDTYVFVNFYTDSTRIGGAGTDTASNVDGQKYFILPDACNYIDFGVAVKTGKTVTNKNFYPMVRLAEIQDDTYIPYAMTNRKLTELALVENVTNDFEFYSAFASANKGKTCYRIGNIIFITYYVQAPADIDSSVRAILKIPSYLTSMNIGNYVVAKGNTEATWGGRVTVDGNDYLSIGNELVASTWYRGQLIGIIP